MRWWLVAALAAFGCSKSGSGGGQPEAGKERGACYGNHTCDQGLECLSDLCVRPPPADCGKVAEKLASYRVGNYAPPDQRDQVVADLTTKCTSAALSADDGKCILDAKTRYDLAACPKPLLEELSPNATGCHDAAANLVKLFVTEMATSAPATGAADKLVPEATDAFEKSCKEDLWPDDARKCVALAASLQDMDKCQQMFPADIQKRIEARVSDVMKKLEQVVEQNIAPPPPPPAPAPMVQGADAGVDGAPATQPTAAPSDAHP